MNTIEITTRATRQLKKLAKGDSRKIYQAIETLRDWPDVQNVKALSGKPGYRLRVGDWRVIFTVRGGRPLVVRIIDVRRRNERTYQ